MASVTAPEIIKILGDELAGVRGEPFEDWIDREGFETDAILAAAAFLTKSWRDSGENDYTLALTAFTLGWSAHKTLRGESVDRIVIVGDGEYDYYTIREVFSTNEAAEAFADWLRTAPRDSGGYGNRGEDYQGIFVDSVTIDEREVVESWTP